MYVSTAFLAIQNLLEKKLAEKPSLFMDSCMIKFMIKFLKAPFSQGLFPVAVIMNHRLPTVVYRLMLEAKALSTVFLKLNRLFFCLDHSSTCSSGSSIIFVR